MYVSYRAQMMLISNGESSIEGGEISLKFAAISVTVVKINPGEEKDWIKWLNAQPEVQVAELNGRVKAC